MVVRRASPTRGTPVSPFGGMIRFRMPDSPDPKRLPKYRLVIVDKKTKNRTIAGAAFESEFGLTLVFGPGVSIDRQTIENCYFNLNSYEEIRRETRPISRSAGQVRKQQKNGMKRELFLEEEKSKQWWEADDED